MSFSLGSGTNAEAKRRLCVVVENLFGIGLWQSQRSI
jgi:hypothetical protein